MSNIPWKKSQRTENVSIKKTRIHPPHETPAVVGVHLRLCTTRIWSKASNHHIKILKVDLEVQGTSQHFHNELAATAWGHQTLDSFHEVLASRNCFSYQKQTIDRYLQHLLARWKPFVKEKTQTICYLLHITTLCCPVGTAEHCTGPEHWPLQSSAGPEDHVCGQLHPCSVGSCGT